MDNTRKQSIKNLIEEKGRISLDELGKRYPDVSSMTLRRDLLSLEEAGEVIRVRGGAVSVKEINKNVEDIYSQRAVINTELKKEIASKAAVFAERGHSIFIDSGSTAHYFTKALLDINYYITTNGLNIAMELSRRSMPVVNLIGGVVNKNNLAASGNLSKIFLDNINIDIAFMVCSGFSEETGFMCGSMTENQLKSEVVAKAKKIIMLMDSSKVNKSMPFTFCKASDIDILVSDSKLPAEIRTFFEERDIEVI
ncbi:MAG: DeoR/GlpR family DNA-binding transcription regulator [Christensenellales bacterium]